jgi:uncharacterized membrane protein YhaH (DUF805 family)
MDYAGYLFGFKGRLNRARYLVVQLALLTFWLVFWLKSPFSFASEWGALHWAVAITMIWINAATTVRRLHDRGRSGWWAIAIVAVDRLSYVYCGLFFGLYFGVDLSIAEELLLVLLTVGLTLLQSWIFIELFFLIGTDGLNRFGPDPLMRTAPNSSAVSHAEPVAVPDFLVHRAGPLPRS